MVFVLPGECNIFTSETVACMTSFHVQESIQSEPARQPDEELAQTSEIESFVKQESDFDSNENAFCGQVDCVKEECDLSDCSVDESVTNDCDKTVTNVICGTETVNTSKVNSLLVYGYGTIHWRGTSQQPSTMPFLLRLLMITENQI